ncbi:MAG: hypothetical protein LC128_06595 [Chitinophagales bacterium]|nr:hypothetical protein [Chitinophagales bacterium]
MKPCLLTAVLSSLLLMTAYVAVTQTVTLQKGLATIELSTSSGTIKVYLPDDIRPGDVITGKISAEPAGKNQKQTGKNLADLKKKSFRINEQIFTADDTDKKFQFLHNQNNDNDRLEIQFFDAKGREAGKAIVPSRINNNPENCRIPLHILTGSPVSIPGHFDGDASNTSCSLDNKYVEIIAESPRQCILSYPQEGEGMHSLQVQESGKPACSQNVSGVSLNVSAGKLDLLKGEKTFIRVNITGLRGLSAEAKLSLTNMTAGTVAMEPSDFIVASLLPDSTGSGIFERYYNIRSLKAGRFIVNVDLELPGVQYEIKKLDKPRRLEDKALHTGLSEAIKKLEADAGGAQGKEYSNMCESCQKCIRAIAGTWAEDLVEKLGEDLIRESVGKAIGMFTESKELLKKLKEMVDKANEAGDKAEKLAEELEKKIREKELQLLVFKDKLCDSNKDCVVSAMIFYDPSTGCVTAFVKCNGRAGVCCPKSFNTAKITYCTDEHGMPKDLPQVEVISE